MKEFIAIVLLAAIGISGRIVFLQVARREVTWTLSVTRYAAWFAVGFLLALTIYQSGQQKTLEWLTDLNWWGAFGALCGIGIGAAVMRYAQAKPLDKPDCKPVK